MGQGLVKDGLILSSAEGKEIAAMLHAKATGKPYTKIGVADEPPTSEKASIVKASKKKRKSEGKDEETPDYGGAKE